LTCSVADGGIGSRIALCTIRVRDILKERILVSRESARQLEEAVRSLSACGQGSENTSNGDELIVDFEGVEGIAPSFLDELITIVEAIVRDDSQRTWKRLMIANPPTRLLLKFEAIGRGHRMSIHAQPDGSWILTPCDSSAAHG